MKKKITRFLLLALTITSVGFLSSCKDYDEERYGQLTLENQSLKDYYKNLQIEIDGLKKQLGDVKQCNCPDFGNLKQEEITNILNFINEAQKNSQGKSFDEYIQYIINNYTGTNGKIDLSKFLTKEDLPSLAGLATQEWVKAEIEKIQPGTSGTSGVSEERVNALIKDAIDGLKKCECGLTKEQVEKIVNDLIKDFVTKEQLNKAIADLNLAQYATQKALEDSVISINTAIAKLETAVQTAQADATEALKWIDDNKANVAKITTIETAVNKMDSLVNVMNTTLGEVKTTADAAKAKADANETALNLLKATVEKIDSTYATKSYVDERVDSALAQIAALDAKVDTLYKEIIKTIDTKIALVNSRIDSTNTNLQALKEASELADSLLGARIDSLCGEVDSLKLRVDTLESQVADLLNRVAKLEDARAKQITNIIIQQVYNPVFGTVAVPAGVSTNILLGCYGEASKAFAFPSKSFGVAPILERNAGDVLVSNFVENSATNANDSADLGTVYVTVNPTDVDFTGFNGFKLVNSQDVESPIALGNVKKSDVTLHFGYTRAANNGFYETTARVAATKAASAQAINIDKHAIKDALTELYKTRSKSQIKTTAKDVATTVFKTAKDVLNLDAQGLKASWTDNYGEHAVISQYAVASTTYKPLVFNSFDAIKGKQLGNLPGYTKAQKLINKVHDTAIKYVNKGFNKLNGDALVEDIQNLKINHIKLESLDPDFVAKFKVTVSDTVDMRGKKFLLNITDKEVSMPLNITATANLDGVSFSVPTLVVSGSGQFGGEKGTEAAIWIPMTDLDGKPVYQIDTKGDTVYVKDIAGKDSLDEKGNRIPMQIGGYIPATTVKVEGTATVQDKVTLPDGTTVTVKINETVKTNITMKDLEVTIPNNDEFLFAFTETVDLSNEINSLWGNVTNQIESVNDMLDDLNNIVADANDLIEDINGYHEKINDNIDKYTNKVLEYLDKINNKSVNAINKVLRNADKILAPTIIVNSDKGLSIAGFRGAPSKASGNVTLIATTYNGELLTPCVAKYVTINGTRAQIGKGGKINASLKKGKNIIKYAALDYAGVEIDNEYVIYYE